jgi:hypothetical protein
MYVFIHGQKWSDVQKDNNQEGKSKREEWVCNTCPYNNNAGTGF